MRDSKNPQNDEEWEATLRSIFLQEEPPSPNQDHIETGAEVISESQISIHIRKNIQGFFQRLGHIDLKHNEDHELDITRWTHTAISRADSLSTEVQTLKGKLAAQNGTIQNLNEQLADLTAAKEQHEEALMAKFCALLNAKKLKIRDQQRLLAGATVDAAQAAQVQASRSGTAAERRSPEKSRAGKRKVVARDEEEEDAFVTGLEVKKEEDDSEEEEEDPRTPEANSDGDDVTTDEEEEDNERWKRETEPDKPDKTNVGNAREMQLDSPPPSRDLPFGEKAERNVAGQAKKASESQSSETLHNAGNGGEETDDDDDEL